MNQIEIESVVENCFLIAFKKIDDYLIKSGKKHEFELMLSEIVKKISSDCRKNDEKMDREHIITLLLATLSKVVDENQRLIKLSSINHESKVDDVAVSMKKIESDESSKVNQTESNELSMVTKRHGFLF